MKGKPEAQTFNSINHSTYILMTSDIASLKRNIISKTFDEVNLRTQTI